MRIVVAVAAMTLGVNLGVLMPQPDGVRPKGRVESSPNVPTTRTPVVPSTTGKTSTTAAPSTTRPRARALPPRRVEVPAIGVDAEVIRLGKAADGSLETPDDFSQAGWWSGGYAPGGSGPAVIVGHVDNKSGPAVFYDLSELVPGDRIEVEADDGTRRGFVVAEVKEYRKVAFPTEEVYGRTDHPTLRLVTCGGPFDRGTGHYVNNVVVYADLAV